MFAPYGKITRSIVKMPQETQTPEGQLLSSIGMSQLYGVGYIEFETEEAASKAMSELNGTKLGN
jgi:RNA recognition motif-containing protein